MDQKTPRPHITASRRRRRVIVQDLLALGHTPSSACWMLKWLQEKGLAHKIGFQRVAKRGRPATVWEVPLTLSISFNSEGSKHGR